MCRKNCYDCNIMQHYFRTILRFDLHCIYTYSVRVANELGAGNGKGAKFAAFVSVSHSMIIGLFFWLLILTFDNKLALIFSSSQTVLEAVHDLSFLLAFTVLLNSIQPILSGIYVYFHLTPRRLRLFGNADVKKHCRGGCWIWMASICSVHKPWVLLFGWSPSWHYDGMGFPPRCQGM